MNALLLTDLVLTLLFIRDLFVLSRINEPLPLILLTVYFALKLLLHVLEERKLKSYLLVLINVFLVITAVYEVKLIVFLPFNLLHHYSINKRVGPFLLAIVYYYFHIDLQLQDDYIIYTLLAMIVVYQDYTNSRVNTKLKDNLEKYKDKYNSKLIEEEASKIMNDNLVYQSQLEERNHLAQQLHDELGHTLAGNIMRLEAIKLSLEQSKSKELLEEVIDNLRTGMDAIRSILKNIKPEKSSLNISGIKSMLSEIKDIDFHLDYSSDISLITIPMWKVINTNIKEAVTNMLKYSEAKNCKITFERMNTLYKVTIVDDGIGCSNIKPGIGITGMQQRMIELDGQLILDGRNGFNLVMIFRVEKESTDGN